MAVAGFIGAVLVAAACREPASLERSANGNASPPAAPTPGFSAIATSQASSGTDGIALDQQNGTLGASGQLIIKGFNPTNPHRGDAIVATFFWAGSTNIIDSVVDVLTTAPNYTPVGNRYTLVEYGTSGGYSMATYMATNVQGFPDPNIDPFQGDILAVGAYLSQPVTEGGVAISAWAGVNTVAAQSLGAQRAASGLGSGITPAGPGSISIGAGALAYAVTMSNGLAGRDSPPGFTTLGLGSDNFMIFENDFAVQAATGSVNPQWTWYFADSPPSTWLATVLALNPPLHLAFTVQPSTTPPLLAIQPAVQVTALDAGGNRVTSFNGSVTIAIGHNGGTLLPGTLSGTTTVTAVNGVATFSNLSIDQLGNGYTLVVSAANVFGAESAPFNIGVM
jgi:hypothetical protein